jgi:class 3 adenylate cyclase/tetratricopeptide (TPR) repeat protein
MTFEDILDQAIAMLQRRGRLTYRALKRQFDLDDEFLEDLKEELVYGQKLAADEDGRVLVWTGHDVHPAGVEPPPVAPPIPEAERRQLTVMFCDLAESTRLAGQLDPEDLRDVVRAYQATCTEVIRRYDGYLAQHLGDGLLVYFGYPQAHEDDARRAVHAGLDLIEAMGALNGRLQRDKGIRLAVRLGIHTGLVVVGDIGGRERHEQLALGETPNIAARLQSIAASDTVVISAATHQLTQGYFACEDLGFSTLKGVAEPVQLYRVQGESDAQSRLDVMLPRYLTPLVGREQEVSLLMDRWARVKEGMGHVVVLSGEAGIGKSRLLRALQDQVTDDVHTTIECRCSPYFQHTALYPVLTMWQRGVGLRRDDSEAVKLEKLERTVSRFDLPPQEAVPLLATVLSLHVPEDRYPPLALPSHRQKQKILETLVTIWLKLAAQAPLLFIVEDLHWVDPSTLELLDMLIDQVPTTPIFILLTCRPGYRLPWSPRAHVTPLTLTRLRRDQVEEMITQVAGGKVLPPEVVRQLVAKIDGIPLFVEELTKTVLESGFLRLADGRYELTGSLPALSIPATLQDSLMARLDRLVTAKGMAQLGAVIGRQFSYALIRAASQLDDTTLQRELGRLVEHEILYQRGLPPHAVYVFKHALIRDAAYQSLLKRTRQQYHQRLAQVLVEHFPDIAATQPELLAHHYTVAGLLEQAIDAWYQAGQRAIERSANLEAISHLTRGLKLLETLPVTDWHTQRDLDMQAALCVPLVATRSITSPEVGQAYGRAWELCQRLGNTPHRFPVLLGLYRFHTLRGEFQIAQEWEEQLIRLAQQHQDPALLVEVHRRLGVARFHRGEFAAARTHCAQTTALYNPREHHAQVFVYGWVDAGVSVLGYEAYALWALGYPDQALRQGQASLRLAEELAHPLSLAFAYHFLARVHQHRRETRLVQDHVERAIAISTAHRFPARRAAGMILHGWALAMQGQAETGIAQMCQGLEATVDMQAGIVTRPYFLALLAEAYDTMGRPEAGLQTIDRALAIVHRTQDYEAELHRLKGELLLHAERGARSATSISEACFHQALDIARSQQAKSLELRAATSLGQLWQQQGKHDEARELLADVSGWFSEGFDTADLRQAKALLETR